MNTNDKPLGLRWHKFMIYCVLWVIAALLLVVSKGFLDGPLNWNLAENIYEVHPVLRRLDSFYAIFFVLLAVYHIYLRYQLANFKAGAPKKLLAMHLAAGAAIAVYAPIGSILTGISFSVTGGFIPLIIGVVLFMINSPYYNHRKELFVN